MRGAEDGAAEGLSSRSLLAQAWRLRDRWLAFDRPVLVGILNLTPDSFFDGGRWADAGAALRRAKAMAAEGAQLIDVGGESSRPGATAVSVEEEWGRLAPLLERLDEIPVPVSVDTTKAEVARRALERGVAAINDISGLRFEPEIASLAADHRAGLILMHMRGEPRTMQDDVRYDDLVAEVRNGLGRSIEVALRHGCEETQLVVDPGLGFGKSVEGSLELIARLEAFRELGRPILVGPSRKSFVGAVLNAPVEERLEGTIAACVMAFERGASLFRVHDVAAARRALELAFAIASADPRPPVPHLPFMR